MTDYKKLVDDLRDIGKTMFALGTTHISMDNVSISLAYDKGWGQTANDAAAAIEALQAQLPKRGKWITIRLNNGGSYTGCSCCEAPIPTDTMLDYIPESESKYCYSCGAKMEVQDADTD